MRQVVVPGLHRDCAEIPGWIINFSRQHNDEYIRPRGDGIQDTYLNESKKEKAQLSLRQPIFRTFQFMFYKIYNRIEPKIY